VVKKKGSEAASSSCSEGRGEGKEEGSKIAGLYPLLITVAGGKKGAAQRFVDGRARQRIEGGARKEFVRASPLSREGRGGKGGKEGGGVRTKTFPISLEIVDTDRATSFSTQEEGKKNHQLPLSRWSGARKRKRKEKEMRPSISARNNKPRGSLIHSREKKKGSSPL